MNWSSSGQPPPARRLSRARRAAVSAAPPPAGARRPKPTKRASAAERPAIWWRTGRPASRVIASISIAFTCACTSGLSFFHSFAIGLRSTVAASWRTAGFGHSPACTIALTHDAFLRNGRSTPGGLDRVRNRFASAASTCDSVAGSLQGRRDGRWVGHHAASWVPERRFYHDGGERQPRSGSTVFGNRPRTAIPLDGRRRGAGDSATAQPALGGIPMR